MELGCHGDCCGVNDWFVASEFTVEIPSGAGDDSCWGAHKGPGLSRAEALSDFAPELEVGPIFAGEDIAGLGGSVMDGIEDGLGDIAGVANAAASGGSEWRGSFCEVTDHTPAAWFPVPGAEHEAGVDDHCVETLFDPVESFFFGSAF